MSWLGPVIKREHGKKQPYIPFGPFEIRLPFIHYRFEIADYTQGLIMCAVCLGIIPVLTEYLGMPFEIAITIVILNGFLYLWHAHLGDPVVPGWITPAIPLLLLWLKTFPEGVPRMHALIAFEFELGLFSLILGATGLANRFVGIVPDALKAGILLGAGVAAVRLVFEKGGRFDNFPWTITIAIGFAFYILFSNHFKTLRSKHVAFKYLSDLGLMPALILAIFVAPLFGELPWPKIEWGFTVPQFTALFTQWTPFSDRIGFRKLFYVSFLAAAPCLMLLVWAEGAWVYPLIFLSGFFIMATLPLGVTLAQTLAPKGRSMVSSLMMGFAFGLGGSMTPIAGAFADAFSIRPVLAAAALIPLALLALVSFLPEPHKK